MSMPEETQINPNERKRTNSHPPVNQKGTGDKAENQISDLRQRRHCNNEETRASRLEERMERNIQIHRPKRSEAF